MSSYGSGINRCGVVVGWSRASSGAVHAVAFDPGRDTAVDLGTLTGGTYSYATAVSDRGLVVGYSDSTTYDFHATEQSLRTHKMTDLGTLPGYDASIAWGVNRRGFVVGEVMSQSSQRGSCTTPPHDG